MGRNRGRLLGLVRWNTSQAEISAPGVAVSNYPFWKLQLGCGLALSIFAFGAAWLTLRRRPLPPRLISWVAVAISATMAGILLGVSAEKMLYESYGFGDWLVRGLLMAAGIAAPGLASNALMSGRALPTFLELIGPREKSGPYRSRRWFWG